MMAWRIKSVVRMTKGRLSAFIAISAVMALTAPVGAFSARAKQIAEPSPLLQLAQRKGGPDDGLGLPTTPEPKSQPDAATSADPNTLEGCMAIWDRDTHITKSEWRKICQRQIKDREPGSGRL